MNNDNYSSQSDAVDAELIEGSADQLNYSNEASDAQPDNLQPSDTMAKEDSKLKSNVLSVEHWLRFVFMALFTVIAFTASYIMFVLIIIQFVFVLITGESNQRLQVFAHSLSQYISQMLSFLTYNSEDKPFPFADWPQQDSEEDEDAADNEAQIQQV